MFRDLLVKAGLGRKWRIAGFQIYTFSWYEEVCREMPRCKNIGFLGLSNADLALGHPEPTYIYYQLSKCRNSQLLCLDFAPGYSVAVFISFATSLKCAYFLLHYLLWSTKLFIYWFASHEAPQNSSLTVSGKQLCFWQTCLKIFFCRGIWSNSGLEKSVVYRHLALEHMPRKYSIQQIWEIYVFWVQWG